MFVCRLKCNQQHCDNGLAAIDTEGHCGASNERLIDIFPKDNWE